MRWTPRRSKYGNVRVTAEGITFDSKAEYRRWRVLKAFEATGQIRQLIAHPSFELCVKGVKVCKYVADSSYVLASGEHVIEDVKGQRTAAFILKKKLMRACWGIEVREIRA